MRRLLVALALALAAGPAHADSPKFGSFELRVSWYMPDIDSEFRGQTSSSGGAVHPYADAFGVSRPPMFQLVLAKSVWISEVGTLDLGFGGGYWEKYGVGVAPTGETGDHTSLKIVPLQLMVGYRVDWFFEQHAIPFAPYARIAFVDHLWWVDNGTGSTASWPSPSGQLQRGSGQTFGYAFTIGVGLVLDFFDPKLAREMDTDTGINHTLFYADATKSFIDDFGSSKSWNMSGADLVWSIGLQLVF